MKAINLLLSLVTIVSLNSLLAQGTDCSTAIPLLSNGCSGAGSYNNTGVTGTLAAGSCFTGGSNNGMWFSFVASQQVVEIVVNGGTLAGAQTMLIDAPSGCGGTFTELSCASGGTATINYSALSIGTTYYIYVDGTNSNQGTFEMCLTSPSAPLNDSPCNPFTIPATNFCSAAGAYSNVGATDDNLFSSSFPACFDGTTNTVWFEFTAVGPYNEVIINGGGSGLQNPEVAIIETGNCNGTSWSSNGASNCASGSGSITMNANNLTPGTTYLIVVDGDAGETGSFQICLNSYTPTSGPPNDDCADAIALCPGQHYTGTTVDATNTSDINDQSWDCNGVTDNAVWYTYVADNPVQNVTFDLNGTTTGDYLQFEVFEFTGGGSPCGNPTAVNNGFSSVGCNSDILNSGSTTVTIPAANMTAGETYYVQIDNWPGQSANFDFTINGNAGANAGPDVTYCEGASATTFTGTPAGGVWSGPGITNTSTGAFDPSGLSAGNYTVFYAYGPCVDQKLITIEAVNVTVSPDVAICAGESVTLTGSITPNSGGPVTFSNNTSMGVTNTTTAYSDIVVSGISPTTVGANPIVSVCLDVTHTYDADLDIYLECPNGTQIVLTSDNGGGSDNYSGTCFTASAGTPITSGSAPFSGTYTPEDPFTNLNGCDINGTWTLIVDDDASGDNGTLNGWSITFDSEAQFTWSPTTNMTNSTTLTPTVTPTSTTTYTLTSTTAGGCTSSDEVTVTVAPQDDPTFTMTLDCTSATSTVTGTAGGTFSFNTAPGDGASIDPSTGALTGATTGGSYSIKYVTPGTCPDSLVMNITLPNCTCFMTNLALDPYSCDPSDNTFDLTGIVEFTNPPTTGNLIVTDCNGNQDVVSVSGLTSPYNFSILGIDSDGTTGCYFSAYFDADPTCEIGFNIDYPSGCVCTADAGTFTQGTTAASNTNSAGPYQYNLCYGDQLDIDAVGDYTPPQDFTASWDVATNGPAPVYDPGIWLLLYSCPPTIGPPNTIGSDPCLVGTASSVDAAWSIINNIGDNSTYYYVPVTMYSMVEGVYAVSINGGDWCYDLGPTYELTFLEDIVTSTAQDCQAGTATVTVNGGLPSANGAEVYTASNLLPGSASFDNTTAGDGGTITISGLVDGDNWSFDIVDTQGCPIQVSGTFVGTEDPSFTYPQAAYCADDADPSPTITGVSGGTFTAPAGVSINASTGVIDLSASTAGGPYTITYTTPDPICFDQATFDITINPLPIVNGNPGTICAGDPYTLNGTGADTYTWTGGVTDGVPFNPGATANYTVTGTITATGCDNTAIITVTVNPLDDPTFTTSDFCEGTPSTTPNVTGLPGGTFAFNPAPGDGATINAASGAITNGVGGTTYTIEYTTNGACPQSSTQDITVNALPLVNVPDYQVCTGGTVTLTATGADTYTWSPGTYLDATTGATVNSTPAVQIDYTVVGTDANGCQNSDLTTVTIIPNAPINAGNDTTICDGGTATLVATGGVTYNWQAPISAAGATQMVTPAATTTYTVDGVDAQGCTGTDQVTVTVNPVPTVDPVANQVICNNANSTTVIFTGSEPGTTYDWTNTDPSIGIAASGSGDIASFTAINTGASPVVATIEVTPTVNGCTGTPIQFTITVNPTPIVDPINDQTVCNGASTTMVTFTGNIGGATYDWTNSNSAIGLTNSGTGNITGFTGTNTGSSQIFGLITVTPSSNGCIGADETFTIYVDPTPTVDAIADQTLCAGDATADIFITGPVAGTTFDWMNSNIGTGLGTNGTGDILSFTTVNGGSNQQVSTVTVTPTAAGCLGPDVTFDIIVNPIPVVDPIASETLCAGEATTAVNFSGNVVGTTYNWVNTNTAIGLPASGSGNITSFTTTNATGAPISGDITVTPVAAGCTGSTITYTITVNPIPVVDPIADQTICANTLTSIVNFTGNVAGASYNWANDNSAIGIGASGSGDIAPFSGVNNSSGQVSGMFTVTPNANGCIGADETFTIYVNPIPVVDPIADQILCANSNTTTVTFTSTTVGTSFAWTNDNTTVGLAASGSGNIAAFTAQNASGTQQVANIVVTPTAVGCSGLTETFAITVNPLPTATISGSTTICEGDASPSITFTGANGTAPYTFTYNINGGANQTAVSSGDVAIVVVPNTPTGTYNYNLVSVEDASSTSCSQNQNGTATVVINPNPTPTIDGASEYCTGTSSTLTTPIAYAGYQWSTGSTSPSVSVTTADNPISVTVTNGFGCQGTSPDFVVIENSVITYNSTVEVCQGDATTIHGVNYTNLQPVTDEGVYSQTYTLPTGCDSTSNVTLVVHPLPTIDAGLDQVECFGTGIILNATGAPTIVWDNGVTNGVSFTPGVGTVTYTATGTDIYGCVNTDMVDVTINPIPSVDPIADQEICNNSNTATVTFTGSVVGTTYNWTNDNTSIGLAANGSGDIASFTATNAGIINEVATIEVTPEANGCTGSSETFTITVNPTPVADNITDQIVCNGNATDQVVFSSNVVAYPNTFDWVNDTPSIGLASSGTGNISPFSAVNNGTAPVVAQITVTPTANGCTGVDEVFTITVNPTPTVDNVANETLCNGENTTAVTFTSPVAGTSFTWMNDNGNIGLGANGVDAIPTFVATNNGTTIQTANITITPTSAGCQGPTNSYSITVNPTPHADAILDQTVCNGSATSTVNFGSDVAYPTTYAWTNSDPSIGLASTGNGNIAAFNAMNNGTTAVTATITVIPTANSCDGPSESFTITVNPTPVISGLLDETVCNGSPTTPTSFVSSVAGSTFTWTNSETSIGLSASGSGNISSFNGINNGNSPVVSTVSVTPIANGCSGLSDVYTITVNPTPTVNPINDQVLCNNTNTAQVMFGGNVSGTTYDWVNDNTAIGLGASGTGSIASFIATNTTANPIVANITVTPTKNGCDGASESFTITVNPTPVVAAITDQEHCAGDMSDLVDFTSATPGTVFNWTNNNTAIGLGPNGSNDIQPFVTTNTTASQISGLISVTPVANGCAGNVETFTINVNPLPTAVISGTDDICDGDAAIAVTFTGANGTAPYTFTYTVNGGGNQTVVSNGNTATVIAPNTTGVYSYQLVSVQDASATSCMQNVSGTATITVHALPNVSAGSDFVVCDGNTAVLTGNGAGVSGTYTWTGGVTDGVPFMPSTTNTYTVTGTDANGCVNTDAVTVTVEELPDIVFSADPTEGCAPLLVTFTDNSDANIANCIWTLSNGTTLNGCGSVSTVFNTGGLYDVSLTMVSVNGCTNSLTYEDYIYVENPPVASFSADNYSMTQIYTTVEFENTSTGAVSYQWNFGDGSGSAQTSPTHVFPSEEAGDYLVELIAYTPLGCTDTAYRSITVDEELIFYVPNTFTPDGDDFNELFTPVFTSGYDPFDFHMMIFNRWGELIWESYDASVGWDGTYGVDKSKIVQDGTYTWKIDFKTTMTDERILRVGHVNVLR